MRLQGSLRCWVSSHAAGLMSVTCTRAAPGDLCRKLTNSCVDGVYLTESAVDGRWLSSLRPSWTKWLWQSLTLMRMRLRSCAPTLGQSI